MADMGLVGEAFIAVRARLDTLEADLNKVKPAIERKVKEIEKTTGRIGLNPQAGRGPAGRGGRGPAGRGGGGGIERGQGHQGLSGVGCWVLGLNQL